MTDEHPNTNANDGIEPTNDRPDCGLTRRGVLSAVGAGIAFGAVPTGVAGASVDDRRRYFECDHVRISYHEFPEDVQAEIDAVLEDGTYESDDPPLLPETMDIEESYVLADGTHTPVVDRTDDGSYVLSFETVENPTLPEPRKLTIDNRSDEDRTLTIRIADPDDEDVLLEDTVDVEAGEQRVLWEMDVIGSYDFTIETDDGQRVEDVVSITEFDYTDLQISSDGDVQVLHAVADPIPCRFEPEDYRSPWVDVALESDRLHAGERTDAHLRLAFTEEGLSEYDLEVTVDDPDVARITDARYDDAFEAEVDPEIAEDGSSVRLRAVDAEGDVPTEGLFVPLATVELEAVGPWFVGGGERVDPDEDDEDRETGVAVTVESTIDDEGEDVDADGGSAVATVANPRVGVDQYAYFRDSTGVRSDDREVPVVAFGDRAVVVHGSSMEGSSACSGTELPELAFDEEDGELRATVTDPWHPTTGACTDDVANVSYELVATVDGETRVETLTLTENAYAENGTLEFEREDEYPAIRGVDDVEFTLVDREYGGHAVEPAVWLEDGAVVISGAIGLPYVACETVEPALIAFDPTWNRLVVEVTDTLRDGVDPDDPCPAEAGVQGYELRVPIDGGDTDSLRRVRVVEPTATGTRLTSFTRSDFGRNRQTVDVDLSRTRLGTHERTTASVVLSSAPDGLSEYELAVALEDSSVVEVDADAVSVPGGFEVDELDVADDAVAIRAVDAEGVVGSGATAVELATVELAGVDEGTSAVEVSVDALIDDDGEETSARAGSATVTTVDVPAIDGSKPRDLNGDGRYRDLTGNGEFGTTDVVTLFENLENPAVAEYPEYYDFDGNARVSVSDVIALFETL